jgi:hypothetical protein
MGLLNDWWNRLTGRATKPAPTPGRRPATKPQSQASSGGLSLAEDPPKQQPRRHRSAGFDPYESDAGEAKPHAWERIDHD